MKRRRQSAEVYGQLRAEKMGQCQTHRAEAVVQELRDVALVMRELILKYEKELELARRALRDAMRCKNRNHQRIALRKAKLLEFHIDQAGKRLHNIISKQYAIEQLGITKLHVEAMQHTSSVFRSFAKKHSVEKVEQMVDTLADLTSRVLEVSELTEEPQFEVDEDAIEKELLDLQAGTLPELLPELPAPPTYAVGADKMVACHVPV